MKITRCLGISLTFVSVLTASIESVIALADLPHQGLYAADVCVLIFGVLPKSDGFVSDLMASPAWIFFGMLGILLIFASKMDKKERKAPNRIGLFY